jgi:hypothetical protein
MSDFLGAIFGISFFMILTFILFDGVGIIKDNFYVSNRK